MEGHPFAVRELPPNYGVPYRLHAPHLDEALRSDKMG